MGEYNRLKMMAMFHLKAVWDWVRALISQHSAFTELEPRVAESQTWIRAQLVHIPYSNIDSQCFICWMHALKLNPQRKRLKHSLLEQSSSSSVAFKDELLYSTW